MIVESKILQLPFNLDSETMTCKASAEAIVAGVSSSYILARKKDHKHLP